MQHPALSARTRGILRRSLLRWYAANRRPFPWRSTSDAYAILVSEFMLQQTQAARVAQLLPPFLKRYPSIVSLARAGTGGVIRAWKGLGYNSRAVRLRDAARAVTHRHGGDIPPDVDALMRLPGIGPYTAHAVACFCHRRRVPVVDVNVRRVLSRITAGMRHWADRRGEKDTWKIARDLLPRSAYLWNQALMELGALVCTARSPRCGSCPVSSVCRSAARLTQGAPAAPRRPEPSHRGIPRRIWRGRIIEVLRGLNGRGSISARDLGNAVEAGSGRKDLAWLAGVVRGLEADGLVLTHSGRVRLPAA